MIDKFPGRGSLGGQNRWSDRSGPVPDRSDRSGSDRAGQNRVAGPDVMVVGVVSMEQFAPGRWDSTFDDGTWAVFPDGTRTCRIHLGEAEDGPAVVAVEFPPGHRFEPHYHACHYVSVVVEGSVVVGRKEFGVGGIRAQEAGTVYGPETVGPNGLRQFLVFGDRRAAAGVYLPGASGSSAGPPQTSPPRLTLQRTWPR